MVTSLSACGGGGGGNTVAVGSGSVPAAVPAHNYTMGSPSSEASADQTIVAAGSPFLLPYVAPDSTNYSSVTAASTALNGGQNYIATVDTDARSAWQNGWTGKNVKIGIADEFNSNGIIDSHGDWVALVTLSVAPEADYSFRDVLTFSSTLVGLIGNADAAFDYFEQNGYHIINNSWGVERPRRAASGAYTGAMWSDFDTLVTQTVNAFDPNAPGTAQGLYILAGGNGGQFCPTRRIENCNWVAAVADRIRQAGYPAGPRLIFVGALDDNSNNLAGYSYIAGNLKNDFIVAHDDILAGGDAAGTSFSSPRVAGAAALVKQKFPSLTSAQIKQVLLQTADDLGASGVDEIYGHGALNIMNALSPQGTVVPK